MIKSLFNQQFLNCSYYVPWNEGRFLNDEVERMRKEADFNYFKALYNHFLGEIWENRNTRLSE